MDREKSNQQDNDESEIGKEDASKDEMNIFLPYDQTKTGDNSSDRDDAKRTTQTRISKEDSNNAKSEKKVILGGPEILTDNGRPAYLDECYLDDHPLATNNRHDPRAHDRKDNMNTTYAKIPKENSNKVNSDKKVILGGPEILTDNGRPAYLDECYLDDSEDDCIKKQNLEENLHPDPGNRPLATNNGHDTRAHDATEEFINEQAGESLTEQEAYVTETNLYHHRTPVAAELADPLDEEEIVNRAYERFHEELARNQVAAVAVETITTKSSGKRVFYKTKMFWIIITIVVLLTGIIAIVIPTSMTSNNTSNGPSNVPSNVPSNNPTLKPSPFNCDNICLAEIQQNDCPENPSLLEPCHMVVNSSICIDDNNCITESSSPKCNTIYHIYRKIICSTDAPWIRAVNGFEYFVETRNMDWASHQQRAMISNASLVSIHSQGEFDFVNRMLSNNGISSAFIGGLRKGKGVPDDPLNIGSANYWKWVDNTTWDFASWESGQPDGQATNEESYESVVSIKNLKMHDSLPIYKYQGVYSRNYFGNHMLSLDSGLEFSCASNLENELYCWGLNNFEQIWDGSPPDKNLPKKINFGNERTITQFAVLFGHGCALLDDQTLSCWGYNNKGQVGDNSIDNRPSPVKINIGAKTNITQLAPGGYHTCVVFDDGTLTCWGDNAYGQLGDNTTVDKRIPTEISTVGNKVKHVALGVEHTCAIFNDGALKCWGENSRGQLGDNTTTDRLTPIEINFENGRIATQVWAGSYHMCVLLDDESLSCWGLNDYGQLGDGTTSNKYVPTNIVVDEKRKIKQISLGIYHTCAVLEDGTVKCWGWNGDGQLGDGTKINRLTPTEINVGVGRKALRIAAGYSHTCAIIDDSTVRCWGLNSLGQLGRGTGIPGIIDASLAQDVDIYNI